MEKTQARPQQRPQAAPARPVDPNFRYFVRIANTDLDGNKIIFIALRKIKGISFSFSNMVCILAGVEKTKKTGLLTEDEAKRLDSVITHVPASVPKWMLNRRKDFEDGTDKHVILNDLIFAKETDIRLMRKIKSYKGVRHSLGLPVRGQRTRSNFRRNKGKGLGVTKKKAGAPAPPKDSKK